MGFRVDRLAAYLRSSPSAERLVAGRVGGGLWLIAAIATVSLPLFPQVDTPLWPWPLLWTICAATWGICAMFVIDWRVAPPWLLVAASAAAVVVVAAITQLTGGVASPARLYIFFVLFYGACFLTPDGGDRDHRRLRRGLGAAGRRRARLVDRPGRAGDGAADLRDARRDPGDRPPPAERACTTPRSASPTSTTRCGRSPPRSPPAARRRSSARWPPSRPRRCWRSTAAGSCASTPTTS